MENDKTLKRLPKINYELEIVRVCTEALIAQSNLPAPHANKDVIALCQSLIYRNLDSIERITNTYEGPKMGASLTSLKDA